MDLWSSSVATAGGYATLQGWITKDDHATSFLLSGMELLLLKILCIRKQLDQSLVILLIVRQYLADLY